jgi:hypothetical protein
LGDLIAYKFSLRRFPFLKAPISDLIYIYMRSEIENRRGKESNNDVISGVERQKLTSRRYRPLNSAYYVKMVEDREHALSNYDVICCLKHPIAAETDIPPLWSVEKCIQLLMERTKQEMCIETYTEIGNVK